MPDDDRRDRPTNGRLKAAILEGQVKELRRDLAELKATVAGGQELAVKFATLAERVDGQGATLKWILGLAGSSAVGTLMLLFKVMVGE